MANTQRNQKPNPNIDLTGPLIRQLGELFSREDKKIIPLYKGDTTITSWLKEAERVARNNQWEDNQKTRIFSDRLKGKPLDWHLDYATTHDQ